MTLYSEMAAMFPDKPGGFPLYAHEGWRKYFTLIGPTRLSATGSPGRSCSRSSVSSAGRSSPGRGSPDEPFGVRSSSELRGRGLLLDGATSDVGLPHLIAVGLILAVWLFNVLGVRVGVHFGYLAGALLMIPLFCS